MRNRLRYVKLIQIYDLLRQGLVQILLSHWCSPRERHLALHELHAWNVELVGHHTEGFHMLAPTIRRGLGLRRGPYLFEQRPVCELLVDLVLHKRILIWHAHLHLGYKVCCVV